MRVALVGAGYFARFHLDAWLRMSNARLVAVCDRDPGTHSHVRDADTDVSVYRDLEAMLDSGIG